MRVLVRVSALVSVRVRVFVVARQVLNRRAVDIFVCVSVCVCVWQVLNREAVDVCCSTYEMLVADPAGFGSRCVRER